MKPTLRGLAASFSITAALLAGCGDESPEALLASAKTYLAKKDLKAAVIQLKSALQQRPGYAEARFLLGQTLFLGGDAVSAEVELRKALDYKYPETAVVPLLARTLVVEGKGQRAIADYGSFDIIDPQARAELKTAIAGAYAQQSNREKSQAAAEQALLAVADYAPALLLQARLQAAAHNFDGALGILDRIISKHPDDYQALQLKGELMLYVKGDAEAALTASRQALAQRPDWLPSRWSVLEILLSRRDIAGAKIELAKLQKDFPAQPQTKYFEARYAFLNKDYKTAREAVQRLLTVAPDNVDALLLAGAIEMEAGSLVQAESLMSRALQRAPDVPLTRRLLARAYLRLGQAPKAMQTLAPLLDKPDADVGVLGLAAEAALQSGNSEAAEGYFTRVSKLDPTDSRSRTALALGQFAKGKPDVGFAQLEEIASSNKSSIADLALINVRMRQRDFDGALKAIGALEVKQPKQPLPSQLRGQVMLARNDVDGARKSFDQALSIDPSYFPAAASLAALDLKDKKPDEARKHLDKLIALDPTNVNALLAIAELRARAGAGKDELAGLLGNAIRLNPTLPAPRLLLVDLNLRNRDAKAAMAVAQDGVSALSDSSEMLDALGRAQMAGGELDQAITSFTKVASMQQNSPLPQLRLADAYMAVKRPDAARRALKRALQTNPKNVAAERGLVLLELSEGRLDDAMAMAKQMQSERPQQGFGYLLAGDVETYRKDWAAAAAAYRAGLARGESSELAAKLHGSLMSAHKGAEADTFASGWIKGHPQDVVFRQYLGDLALSRSDFASAESQYSAIVAAHPENSVALNNLAWAEHKLNKPGAAAHAEKATTLQPREPAFIDTLATILADSGQTGKALDLQKKAVALSPDQPTFRLNLAKQYLKAGDKPQAKLELDTLAKLGDKFPGQLEVGQLMKTL